MKIASVYLPRITRALIASDFLTAVCTIFYAIVMLDRTWQIWPLEQQLSSNVYAFLSIGFLVGFIMLSNFSMGMYQRRYMRGRKLVKSALASGAICLAGLLIFTNLMLPISVTFLQACLITCWMFAVFTLMRPIMRNFFESYVPKWRVALIGSPVMAERFRWAVDGLTPSDAVLVDHYPYDRSREGENLTDMVKVAQRNPNVDEIFVEMPTPDLAPYGTSRAHVKLNSTSSFFDRYGRWVDNELVHAKEAEELAKKRSAGLLGKRIIEGFVSLAVFIFFLPLFIGAIVAIKLEDGGSIFYRQTRVGKNGKLFTVLKFRSMIEDAERGGAPQWAMVGDSRVTRVGAFLRKSRIDELPQLWNVIRGDMALVGPRPERPEFVDQLSCEIPNYQLRHVVRPGLTGWAQISYPYGASIEDSRWKTRLDLYYIANWTIWFDLAIIAQTVRVVLLAEGSR